MDSPISAPPPLYLRCDGRAIAMLGSSAIVTMPVDIFPYIDIPVVSVVWNYAGISPDEMESRIVTVFERAMTTTVNDIEHIESQSYNGVSVTRLFSAERRRSTWRWRRSRRIVADAAAHHAARNLPAQHLKYDASSVPIIHLAFESKTLSEQEIFDLGRTSSARSWRPFRAPPCRFPTAASSARSWWISNPDALYAKQLSADRCFQRVEHCKT